MNTLRGLIEHFTTRYDPKLLIKRKYLGQFGRIGSKLQHSLQVLFFDTGTALQRLSQRENAFQYSTLGIVFSSEIVPLERSWKRENFLSLAVVCLPRENRTRSRLVRGGRCRAGGQDLQQSGNSPTYCNTLLAQPRNQSGTTPAAST